MRKGFERKDLEAEVFSWSGGLEGVRVVERDCMYLDAGVCSSSGDLVGRAYLLDKGLVGFRFLTKCLCP